MRHIAPVYSAFPLFPDFAGFLGRFRTASASQTPADRSVAAALKKLSGFEDHQLADIGLCRSDLTPDGLAIAGARRSRRQAELDGEAAIAAAREVA
jgi:hypothetical protein